MTDDKVAQIIDKRKKAPIKDLKELSGIITDSSLNKWLTVSSSLYCINITVEHSGRKIEARGIYDRNNKKYFYLKIN